MATVLFSAPAAEQLAEASEWRSANRDKAPTALIDDVAALLSLLEECPTLVGRPIEGEPTVRRVHLQRIRYYTYFEIKTDETVEILAFWHERRGSEPDF